MSKDNETAEVVKIRDRIKELIRVPASLLQENPRNPYTHSEKQREAIRTVLKEIGIAGAVLVRKLGKKYVLIDGHLRREEIVAMGDAEVPALVLDVTDAEADQILLTFNHIATLVGADEEKMKDVLRDVRKRKLSERMRGVFASLSQQYLKEEKEDDGTEEESGEGEAGGELEASHVRMLQFFMNTDTLPPFQEKIKFLGKVYQTGTLTDTVIKAVETAFKVEKRREREAGEESER